MKPKIVIVFFCLLFPALIFAIKTPQVEFGANGSYDGLVKIFRDDAGRLIFMDESLTSPIALNQIGAGNRAHGSLSGLGNDDHRQYLNGSRHGAVHARSFNNHLPAGPDAAGNTTIGEHLQDEDIHLSRSLSETISGAWRFDVQPEFMANIKFSQHGQPGKMDISFENGATDARLRWDNATNRFEFNKTLYAPQASLDALIASRARFSGDVLGNLEGAPHTGRIANFASIEGIASENLLDKSADEVVSGSWRFCKDVRFQGDIATSGTIRALNGFIGLGKAKTIAVAKSGGDFDDIHDAVAASSAGDVILVFPGTYTVSSSININKNITVAGVDRKACIIEREHASSAEVAYDDGVFLFSAGLPDGARLANLTIKNTGNSTGTYATPAVIATDGNNHIQNCYIGGNGGSDILCFLGSSVVSCDMVTVEQYKYLSNASPIIRARGSAFLTFEHGEVLTRGAGGGTQLNTTGDAAFRWTDFHNTEGIDVVKCDTLTLFGCRKDAAPFLISNNYTALNVNSCDYMDAFVNYGNLSLNSDSDIGGKKLFKMHWYDNPDNYYFKIDPIDGLYWGEGDNENYDTRLFRSPNSGVGTNSVYSSHALLWKDWAAVAACGTALVCDGNRGRNVGWSPGYGDEAGCFFYIYLLSDDDGQKAYFPIPYEAGTILTRLRVKWCANAQNNGIKVRFVKRDETAYNDSWTVVGAQQSYIDSAGDLNININTYDFADETMQANHSYAIEVESVVDNPVGVRLYSFGIETSKRVY